MLSIDLINILTGNPFPSTKASGRKVFLIEEGQRFKVRVTLGGGLSHYELVLSVDGFDTLNIESKASLAPGQSTGGILVTTSVYERSHFGGDPTKVGCEFVGHNSPGGGENLSGLIWVAMFEGDTQDKAGPLLPVEGENETSPWIRNPFKMGLDAVEFGTRESLAARGVVVPEINQHWPPKGVQYVVRGNGISMRPC